MKPFVAICIALLFPANASAADGGLWIFPVARLCIGQDPAYAQRPLGQWIMQWRLGIRSPEFDRCAREKNWLPREMCDEVMSLASEEATSRANLERLYNKYASALRASSAAGEYFEAFDKAESTGTALPSCPRDATASTPPQRFGIFAAANDDSLDAFSQPVGAVNEWRLIPGVLLAHCANENPQSLPSMRATYESWRQANEPLIFMSDRVIDRVAPLYAGALAVSDSDAKDRMVAFTTAKISDTYIKNDKGGESRGCADYDRIVAGLSSAGKVAATRGFVYAVEAMLAARKPTPPAQRR